MDALREFEKAKNAMETCKNSQLVLESRNQHIKLAPKYIGNIRKGVHKQLSAQLSHPDRMSGGFPLAYNNVKVKQRLGKMISDQPCIHFDIQADFIMFKPVVGCKLNGKVNKVAKRHLGLLVHSHFNAWVPHTSQTEKIAADQLIESEIEFAVQDIFINRNVLSITGKFGKFLSENLQEKNDSILSPIEMKSKKKKKSEVNCPTTVEMIASDSEEKSPKKKKKHKKDKAETSADLSVNSVEENNSTVVTSSDNEGKPHKKKQKRKKDKKVDSDFNDSVMDRAASVNDSIASLTYSEPLFTSTQVDDFNNNDTAEIEKESKHKKKKKHKRMKDSDGEQDDEAGAVDKTGDSRNNSIIDIANRGLVENGYTQRTSKNRKRAHGDNSFTNLEHSQSETDMAVPSSRKKLKMKVKTVTTCTTEIFDSSADFEDSSVIRKKEKKKHKGKST